MEAAKIFQFARHRPPPCAMPATACFGERQRNQLVQRTIARQAAQTGFQQSTRRPVFRRNCGIPKSGLALCCKMRNRRIADFEEPQAMSIAWVYPQTAQIAHLVLHAVPVQRLFGTNVHSYRLADLPDTGTPCVFLFIHIFRSMSQHHPFAPKMAGTCKERRLSCHRHAHPPRHRVAAQQCTQRSVVIRRGKAQVNHGASKTNSRSSPSG